MAPRTSAPRPDLIADLPVTLAGFWTAVTLTQHVAQQLADRCPPEDLERQAAIACLLTDAADGLAGSRSEALLPAADLPEPWLDPDDGLVGALAGDCIDLAVDVLGNEEEPLTSFEVLAITRAVTALCSTRGLAKGGIA